MIEPTTYQVAKGVVLGVLALVVLLSIGLTLFETKPATPVQPRTWKSFLGTTAIFGIAIACCLLYQRFTHLHGLMAIFDPFLIPAAICARSWFSELTRSNRLAR